MSPQVVLPLIDEIESRIIFYLAKVIPPITAHYFNEEVRVDPQG
jgi:hypothetical protein